MRTDRLLVAVRALLVAALAASLLAITAGPAAACSCAGAPFDPDPEFGGGIEDHDAVFVGTVVSATQDGLETRWQFDVDYVVHGEITTPVIVVTASNGAACGFEGIVEGSERAVGVRRQAGEWQSGLCSIDRPEAVAHISFRGEPTVDTSFDHSSGASGPPWGLLATGAGFAAVVAAVAGSVVLARRPRSA